MHKQAVFLENVSLFLQVVSFRALVQLDKNSKLFFCRENVAVPTLAALKHLNWKKKSACGC